MEVLICIDPCGHSKFNLNELETNPKHLFSPSQSLSPLQIQSIKLGYKCEELPQTDSICTFFSKSVPMNPLPIYSKVNPNLFSINPRNFFNPHVHLKININKFDSNNRHFSKRINSYDSIEFNPIEYDTNSIQICMSFVSGCLFSISFEWIWGIFSVCLSLWVYSEFKPFKSGIKQRIIFNPN